MHMVKYYVLTKLINSHFVHNICLDIKVRYILLLCIDFVNYNHFDC